MAAKAVLHDSLSILHSKLHIIAPALIHYHAEYSFFIDLLQRDIEQRVDKKKYKAVAVAAPRVSEKGRNKQEWVSNKRSMKCGNN